MTENETPKPDYLMWWLILSTILATPSWYLSVEGSYYTFDSVWRLFIISGTIAIVMPLLLYFSWANWRNDEKLNSTILSILLVILSIVSFIMYSIAAIF